MGKRPVLRGLAVASVLCLVACGGGGGGDSAPAAANAALPAVAVSIPTATYPAGSAELGAWTVLQQARVLCGFGALKQDTRLDAAALSHARYLTSISLASGESELSHFEYLTSDPFYTGDEPWDRTMYQRYGTQVAEILEATVWDYDIDNPPVFPSLQERGERSMLSLLNTVYHLTGALYEGADVGMGADLQTYAKGVTLRREEYRFGSLNGYQSVARRIKFGAGKLVTYPCQGSSGIPPTFVPANERPNPFPGMTGNQSVGPPIYLKVDGGQVLKVSSSSVSSGGVAVPTTLLTQANDPNQEITANEAFLVPTSALSANRVYQVSLTGSINGTPFSRSFSMSTGQ